MIGGKKSKESAGHNLGEDADEAKNRAASPSSFSPAQASSPEKVISTTKAKDALRVVMLAPARAHCGIGDYSRRLRDALSARPDIAALEMADTPANAYRTSGTDALRHFVADDQRFAALGAQLNASGCDLAHVQHQYFFFGGVAPHKNHARAFFDALTLPLVLTVHEIARPRAGASLLTRQALARVNRANFLHPAIRQWTVHTRADRDHLAALGVDSARIHVIGVGVPAAQTLPEPEAARRALGLEGRRVLTQFGFLSAKKGHRLALDALTRLSDDTLLLFAGEQHPDDHTDYVAGLHAQAKALGVAARVRFLGYVSDADLPTVMAATDVALAPFVESSGSASLAHLLAYTRPIVASDIAPHRELAANAPDALRLFRAGDADDLAAQIAALLDDARLRAQLQTGAQAYAARHSFAAAAAQFAAVYRLALEIRIG